MVGHGGGEVGVERVSRRWWGISGGEVGWRG